MLDKLTRRFRDWLESSIANRLTLAAVTLTMSVVGVVGLFAFIFGYLQIERSVHSELSAEVDLFEKRLDVSLGILQKDMAALSANTLVATGLLDSQGRETYLNPFLRDYRSPLGLAVMLSLHDFQGGAIAGNHPGGLPSFTGAPWVEDVITEGRPHAMMLPGERGTILLLAWPVLYPATGRAEGILVAELNLSTLFRNAAMQGAPRFAKHLLDKQGRHVGEPHHHETPGNGFLLLRTLKLEAPMSDLGLQVEVSAARWEMLAPLYWMSGIYLAAGGLTLIFVLWATRRLVGRLIQPLVKLSDAAGTIAAGNLASVQVEVQGRDEIGKLAQSFNSMTGRLHESWRLLEQRVAERTRELQELNETLEQRVHEEAAKSREKDLLLIQQSRLAAMGEMIGNIAHQWRQPLNTIGLTFANIKDAWDFNDLTGEYLEEATQSGMKLTQQMSTTIDDFRNFFRPNREAAPFSLTTSVENALELVEASFKSHEIAITLKVRADVRVMGFANEYAQVLLNLLGNARNAIIEKGVKPGQVGVEIGREGSEGYVVVRDNGGGIPDAILGKIFDPYFTTRQAGTGIGLYMSKMIIENNMHGRIEVRNIGGGAEFRVVTPLAEDVADDGEAPRVPI
jgi:signal transduction histidine kinase